MRRLPLIRLLIVTLASMLVMCRSAAPPDVPRLPRVDQLTLDEKIGQMFVYPAHAFYMSESSPAYETLVRQVRENKIGGVIWFVSNIYETAWLTRKLQEQAAIPLLISADIEAGIGMRMLNTTYWPPAMAVAATGDPALAEEGGRIAAIESRAIGINHILAPVADVNVNPDNPVINTRSFGEDPHDVSRFVAAFIRGVQSQGVLATAKHFPGHGDTHADSHRSPPLLDVTRERLESVELVPFRAAIDAGVASVMMGHLGVPALDPTPAPLRPVEEWIDENTYATTADEVSHTATMPASLSSAVIRGLLRREMGFDGLVVSDAFDMGGLVAHFDPGEAAVRAVEAGEDQILKSPNTDAAIAAVKAAVRSGRISEEVIDAAVRRILEAKSRVDFRVAPQEEIFAVVDRREHRETAAMIAQRAITLVREASGALPIAPEERIALLIISDEGNPLGELARVIRRSTGRTPPTFVIGASSREDDLGPFIEAAATADVVVVALAIRAKTGAGHLAVPAIAHTALAAIPASARTIAVSFGSPYVLRELPQLPTYLCAYGIQPVMQSAAVAALLGRAPISGTLPVTISPLHQRGEGIRKDARSPKKIDGTGEPH